MGVNFVIIILMVERIANIHLTTGEFSLEKSTVDSLCENEGVQNMDSDSIRLYHRSEYIIEKPMHGKGSTRNDYGRGFYCTENIELAKEWACSAGNSHSLPSGTCFGCGNGRTDGDIKYEVVSWKVLRIRKQAIISQNR